MSTFQKTNAMRILEKMELPYTTVSYEVDEEHLDAVTASEKLGIDPNVMFKTIVMVGASNQIYVFCTPAAYEISLKKAREITGEKSISGLPLKELQSKTGYIRGGCSPLGMIKVYPTYIEETALLADYVYVSAGVRGTMLCLKPQDLIKASSGTFASFI